MAHPTPQIIISSGEPFCTTFDFLETQEAEPVGWEYEEDGHRDYPAASPWTDETVKER